MVTNCVQLHKRTRLGGGGGIGGNASTSGSLSESLMQTLADSDWWTWEVGGDFGTNEPNIPEVVSNGFMMFHAH